MVEVVKRLEIIEGRRPRVRARARPSRPTRARAMARARASGRGKFFTRDSYAKRGICRRSMSVCLSVCLCVCHTPVLYQNG